MARVIQISREAMQKAWALGRKMALAEPSLRPLLAEAEHMRKYEDFRILHRSQLESHAVFAPWDDQLTALAEKEARRIGLKVDRTSASLDLFINKVVIPMKHALWLGWEGTRGLDRLFAQVRLRVGKHSEADETQAPVFRASQLAERVQQPELDETGDDGFLLAITGDGKPQRDKDKPAVLAASKMVNLQEPEAPATQSQPPGAFSGSSELAGASLATLAPASQTKASPSQAVISDEDMPDPYA